MFVKAITFIEVRRGDVVCKHRGGFLIRVEAIAWRGCVVLSGPIVQLSEDKCPEEITGEPAEVLGLVHRPWPEGKTEEDMLQPIQSALCSATRVDTLPPGKTFNLTIHQCRVKLDPFRSDDALRAVREAIDAYELGKPFDAAQGKPPRTPKQAIVLEPPDQDNEPFDGPGRPVP